MSDNFQKLAFDSIEPSAAGSIIEHAVQWMISNGYVNAERTECVYGSKDGLGHQPGPRWREIVDEAEEQRLWNIWSERIRQPAPIASEMVSQFLSLSVNGLEASAGREACHSGGGGEASGNCPFCNKEFAPRIDFVALVERWHRGEASEIECPNCHTKSRLEDWDWQSGWVFAQASLTFWNWPMISSKTISRLSAALGGLRIRHTHGRL